MKNLCLRYLMLILSSALVVSCGTGQSGSDEYDEENLDSPGISGVFVKDSDTLKITELPDDFFKEIDFDLNVLGSTQQVMVFDRASFVSGTEDETIYSFNNMDEMFPRNLSFIYSFKEDTWTVVDSLYMSQSDSSKVDLTGLYKRE